MLFRKKQKTDFTRDYDGYNQNYDFKLANLESKYASMKESKEYFEKEYKKLKGLTESLCKSIVSNKYNISQLGGNSILEDLDIYKLIEFTKLDYQQQKIENMETLKKLNEQIKMQGVMIESLKQQLAQAMLERNKDISLEEVEDANIIDNTETIEPPAQKVAQIERDPLGLLKKKPSPSKNIETPLSSPASPVVNFAQNKVKKQSSPSASTQSGSGPTLTIENLDAYMSTMTDVMWDILEAIGTEGYAKSNDILDWINKNDRKNTQKVMF